MAPACIIRSQVTQNFVKRSAEAGKIRTRGAEFLYIKLFGNITFLISEDHGFRRDKIGDIENPLPPTLIIACLIQVALSNP